jgi:hypothetical protein
MRLTVVFWMGCELGFYNRRRAYEQALRMEAYHHVVHRPIGASRIGLAGLRHCALDRVKVLRSAAKLLMLGKFPINGDVSSRDLALDLGANVA